ncbi:MAG: hypothetical protein RIE08_12710 [Acidimicrobiales bacterium]
MTKSPKFIRVLLPVTFLVVLALLGAACGGDDPEFADEGSGDGAATDDGSGGDAAGGDSADGSTTDDGSGGGVALDDGSGDGASDGSADPTPTPATASTLPDPLPEPALEVGQPTSEDAVFLYVVTDLGVAYVGDCRNLDPADYETGTYCSVKDGNSYAIGQAPDLIEATIVVAEGGDGWIVQSTSLN